MRPKATATRSEGAPAPTAARANEPASIEALGQQLRGVLTERRVQSLSLCDHEGNVLWLSEGALGPDENMLVLEALEELTGDPSLPCHETTVEDGRLAVFLPVRSPTGVLVGLVMILSDSKTIGDDTLERMTAGPVRTIMQRLAVLLKPGAASAATHEAVIPMLDLDLDPDSTQPAVLPPRPPEPPPRPPGNELMTSEEIDDILELQLCDEPIAVTPVNVTPVSVTPLNGRPANVATMSPPPAKGAVRAQPVPAAPAATAAVKPALVRPGPAKPAPTKPAGAPRAPAAAAPPERPVSEDSRSDMVRLEFIPEPPVVHAAAIQPAPAPAVTPPPRIPRAAPAAGPAPAAAPHRAPAPPPPPAGSIVHGASDAGPPLDLLPFAKLRAGGQTRRFQIQPRAPAHRDPAALDALVLQRLVTWLAAHRSAWNTQPTSFTLNLSIATLEDAHFAHRVGAVLNASGIAGETLGFEIAEPLCAQRRASVERFLVQCEKLGTWVVIDDFTLDSQVMPLLCSKAVRLLKIDPRLTSTALRDKLAQATVVATLQAAKVLGIHCAAKKVDSPASLQWLTAIGCDFAQGAALAAAHPLEVLLGLLAPPGR